MLLGKQESDLQQWSWPRAAAGISYISPSRPPVVGQHRETYILIVITILYQTSRLRDHCILYHRQYRNHGTRSNRPRDRGLRPAQERQCSPPRSNQGKTRESRHRPQPRLPRSYTSTIPSNNTTSLTTTTVPPSRPSLPPRRLRHPQLRQRIHRRRHPRRQEQNRPLLRRQGSQGPHRAHRHRDRRLATQRPDRPATRRTRAFDR